MKSALASIISSYKGKWLIAIFSLCLLMFLLLIADRAVITRQFIYEREMQWVNHIGELLTNFVGDNLFDKDTNDVKRIISTAIEQPDVDIVSLVDRSGMVRYSSDKRIEHKELPFVDSDKNKLTGNIFYKTFPITYKQVNLGHLQIGFSLRSIRQHLSTSLYRVFFIEVLLFFAVLFIAWGITGRLLKPLYEMKEVSNKIAAGNFSIRAHSTSHDIIGDLAAALNNMALQLGDLTDNMKIRIQEATSDLLFSNDQLMNKSRELEESNRKLKELDRLKSDFVSMVSHELRTPLTSIIGFSRTLLTLELPPDQIRNYLGIIESEGKRLSGLIEEYLDISKIEAGAFSLKNETVDLAALVREVAGPLALNVSPTLRINAPAKATPISGDREHLKRVIINLVDNAIKYSPPEKEIVISLEELDHAVIVRIKDSGPGIKESDHAKLFDKFFRGSDPVASRTRGSGLGLAIAKGIIEAHHGTIWAESGVGKGSVFCFQLPLQATHTVDKKLHGEN
jgi:signal transduction histidine kinase